MLSLQKSALFAVCIAVALFGFSTTLSAQQVFGSIFGTVTDPSGAAVNGAKVTITETSKGTSSEVTSNESGNYTKGQLIPGTYQVSIEAPGFQKAVSNAINVQVDFAARFDVALQVGNVTQEVDVTAAAPLLQSDRADVAQTFTSQQIEELPSIGRNAQAMELLNPGTVRMGWAHASDENPQGSVQMEVNGQLFSAMGYELDGTTNQDPILGIIVVNPTFDSLAELKQANQNFDAEFEYVGGGVATYSTKSGSNQFHGDMFEFLQTNTQGFTTNARNPFTNANPVYHQNLFGGSIGGRIIKDKLFFFGDAELNRQAQGGSVLTSVPNSAERGGNLGDFLSASNNYQIYDPATGNADGTGRLPFANNVIPTPRLSTQALAIMNYFPSPNSSLLNTPYQNNYSASGSVAITKNQWNTRWDYYLNPKNTIFGRYSYAAFTEQAPGAFGLLAGGPTIGNYAGKSNALNQSLALGWTSTISPTLVNEFRIGYMRYHVFDVPNGFGTNPATQAGIPGLNLDKTYTSGMPYFDIQNPNASEQLGYALGVNQCNCPLTQSERQIQFIDNLNKTHGNHSFKFGADLRYALNLRVPSDSHRAGELYFNNNYTAQFCSAADPCANGATSGQFGGLGLATFLLGGVSSFQRYVSTSTDAQERQKRFFWYGQDEWRVSPKLTLTLGLRWEMVFPESVNAAGNGATLDIHNGLMYVFGVGGVSSHGIQTMNWHNLAPRAGIAYQVNQKTVVRAGYGWAYNLGTFGSTFGHNVTQNPPVLTNQQPSTPNGVSFLPVFTLAQGPPSPPATVVGSNGTFLLPDGINPKFRPDTVTLPSNYLYNATIEHQLTNKIAMSAGYVGNSSRHSFFGTGQSIDLNTPLYFPGAQQAGQSSVTNADKPYFNLYGWSQGLSYYCNCSTEQYNSLQSTIKVNALSGWTVQGNYTYQRQRGDGWGPYNSAYYFLYDRSAGKGYDDLLPRNQVTIAQNYDIPFGKGRKYGSNMNRVVDAAFGSWTISGITTFYSGLPLNPTLENYGSSAQPWAGPNNRPMVGSGSLYPSTQNRNQWINGCPLDSKGNPSCTTGPYLFPGSYTFGNFPIGTMFGPHFINQDFTLAKNFHITERVSFGLRMDSTNFFNHTNLNTPNTDVQSPTVGQITSIAFGGNNGVGMRKLQFAGNIRF